MIYLQNCKHLKCLANKFNTNPPSGRLIYPFKSTAALNIYYRDNSDATMKLLSMLYFIRLMNRWYGCRLLFNDNCSSVYA